MIRSRTDVSFVPFVRFSFIVDQDLTLDLCLAEPLVGEMEKSKKDRINVPGANGE